MIDDKSPRSVDGFFMGKNIGKPMGHSTPIHGVVFLAGNTYEYESHMNIVWENQK